MNYINFYLKPLNKVLMAVFVCCTLISTFSSAQLANIDYSVRVDRILSYEGGFFGPCWESGTEEYTAWGGFTDNINNSISWASCLTCNSNGNCSYGAGAFAGSRSNTNAYTINYYLYAFENDAGSRCFYDSGDDCYYFGSPGFSYIRENAFPSASTYTNGPDAQASSSHRIRLEWSWRYSGNSNTLAPSCLAQTANYAAGAIRSWSANLSAGRSYQFSTLGNTTEDTYIRIYGANGYTIVASNDDFGSLQSLVNFTPNTSGVYYIEVARYVRNALNSAGGLTFQDVSTPAINGGVIASNSTICSGASISLSSNSAASGGFDGTGFNYQWQSSPNNSSWTNINGATGTNYAPSSVASTTYYRRSVSDCKATVAYSNTVIVTVAANPTVSISSSVSNATICSGGETALTATISGGTGTLTYNWQYENPAGSGNYTNINGATGTGTSPFSTVQNASPSISRFYRLVVSNNQACSGMARQLVTVVPDPVATITTTDISCNGGNDGTATAVITGGIPGLSYAYNWFPGAPNGDGTLAVSDLSASTINFAASNVSAGTNSCYNQVINLNGSSLNSSTNNFNFTSIPSSPVSGQLILRARGDLDGVGSNEEKWTIRDENGNNLGAIGASGSFSDQCNTTFTSNINLTTAQINAWAANGSIDFSAIDLLNKINVSLCNSNFLELRLQINCLSALPGCNANASAVINEPTVLSANTTASPIACNGQTSTVTIATNGGTAPYTYAPVQAFINEIHYDNAGADVGEAIEIAGTAGLNLNGWTLQLYNGSNGTVYKTVNLSGVLSNDSNGFGFISESISGIQNGSPDGIALIDAQSNVIQFLSYEGTITAVNGAASGMTSTDIGVNEASSTNVGFSLQLEGAGSKYQDFSWIPASASTFGTVNNSQTFVPGTGVQNSNVFNGLMAGFYTFIVTDANGCSISTSINISEPSQLIVNATAPQILCSGGSTNVMISATGGVAPYIGTGVFSQVEGIFNYQITDNNGCIARSPPANTACAALWTTHASVYNQINCLSDFEGDELSP